MVTAIKSAAGVARRVSRLLRENGFLMAKDIDKYHRTKGFTVHRVGCSSSVALHWSVGHVYDEREAETKEKNEQKGKVKDFLLKAGYPIDDRLWIECENS